MSIYLDANLENRRIPIIDRQYDILVFRHPNRDCLYGEAETCKKLNLGDHDQIDKQVERYRQEGFPEGYGLSENKYIIRQNNNRVRRFNEIWWQEYVNGCERDQVSMMYAVWKSGVRVGYLEGKSRKNGIFKTKAHNRERTSQEV